MVQTHHVEGTVHARAVKVKNNYCLMFIKLLYMLYVYIYIYLLVATRVFNSLSPLHTVMTLPPLIGSGFCTTSGFSLDSSFSMTMTGAVPVAPLSLRVS